MITPLVMSQTFADCECVAVPLHEGGGPGRSLIDDRHVLRRAEALQWRSLVAVPPKYAPLLSAAYCSS